jgi:hypothetical protein
MPGGTIAIDGPKQCDRKKQSAMTTAKKETKYERIEIHDQRPHLRNDRGRSNRSPRRTRWKDVLLLQRPLSAKVSVHDRRREARGKVSRLLRVTSARTSQATVARNEFANLSFAGTEQTKQNKKGKEKL